MSETTPIASEGSHWYTTAGEPMYEVPKAKGDGMRPTTLADARKLDLVPSVTMILNGVSKPGLDAWKLRQMFEVAYTTPRSPTESDEDFFERVSIESREKSRKAAELGTELHAVIEEYITHQHSKQFHEQIFQWKDHLQALENSLKQYGIDIFEGKAEHSFASPLGYGGKLDWHNDEIVCDFKTKDHLNKKQLAWPEHCWQLAAYRKGLAYRNLPFENNRRLINVFIGVDDKEVRIHEWSREDSEEGWAIFNLLLDFWQRKNHFGKYSKKANT